MHWIRQQAQIKNNIQLNAFQREVLQLYAVCFVIVKNLSAFAVYKQQKHSKCPNDNETQKSALLFWYVEANDGFGLTKLKKKSKF